MKTKKGLRTEAKLPKTNIKSILLFEILCRVITTVGLTPLLMLLFYMVLTIAGIPYLGNETVGAFFGCPATWIALPIALVLIAFATLTEIFGVITAIHESRSGRRLGAWQIMRAGIEQARRAIRPRNIALVPFVLFVLPFVNIIPISGLLSSVRIPGFIMDVINANTVFSILYTAVSVVLLILVLNRIFLLYTFALRGEDLRDAHRNARQLIRRRRLRVYVRLILHHIKIAVMMTAVAAVLSAVAMVVIRFTAAADMRHYYALQSVHIILIAAAGIFGIISPVLSFSEIYALYAHACEETALPCEERKAEYPKLGGKARIALLIATILPLSANVIVSLTTPYDIRPAEQIEVAAHRGYSTIYPENNMPAFRGAIDCRADWIELDVHQTKDGVVVVTHDADINRIAGVNRYVYDLTFEELESYDVGSWFSPEFKGLRVATLDEVLKLCKDRIRVQIELKPTGHETDFEEHVVQIVRDNDFGDQCYMASMNVPCLKRVREIAPDLKTLYIAAAALGDMTAADFADAFSVEETNMSAELVAEMHAVGKPCFVWTINDPDSVPYLIDCNVDGILSDDPVMLRKALLRDGMNEAVVELIDLIYGEDSYHGLFDPNYDPIAEM